jgi:dolichol-phosphate mannosyltransferase
VATLSVVLPAYNEQDNVAHAIARAVEVLPELVDEFEVIVVNDGSSDATAERVHELVNEHHPRVRLISHTSNQGYGAALRTGFHAARHGLIFYTDSDNQFEVAEVEHFLPMMQDYDAVVGFRVYRYDPVLRSILSWIYNRLVRVTFRVKVRDVDCSFKVFRREVVQKLDLESTDFFVDTEIVARARRWNFRIAEKGVRHYPRTAGATTVRSSDIPGTLRTVARMWQRIYYPSKGQIASAREAAAELERTVVEATPTR